MTRGVDRSSNVSVKITRKNVARSISIKSIFFNVNYNVINYNEMMEWMAENNFKIEILFVLFVFRACLLQLITLSFADCPGFL